VIRRYLFAGLLIWVPLGITLWVVNLLVSTLDLSLGLLPPAWQPEALFGFRIPGLGVILTLAIVLGTGALAANFLGQKLVRWTESLVARIPIVKSIYNSVKQVSDTLLKGGGQAFRQPLLVHYPHQGSWTIGFLTGKPGENIAARLQGDHVNVFVPTTPNPTSGFFLIFRREDVIELDMSVDEALKYVISGGVVSPPPKSSAAKASKGAAAG